MLVVASRSLLPGVLVDHAEKYHLDVLEGVGGASRHPSAVSTSAVLSPLRTGEQFCYGGSRSAGKER